MSSFSGQVSQATDNCIQQSAWNGSGPCSTNNTTTGAFAPGTVEACAQRFNNVTIPNGATITAASLNLYVASTKGAATGSGTLDCEAADNAAGFGASPANGLLYGLPLTGHGSTWSFPAESSTGFVTTADFSAAIQAVVNRPGWASGNSIVVLLYNPSSGCDINFKQYDGTASEAPRAEHHVHGRQPARHADRPDGNGGRLPERGARLYAGQRQRHRQQDPVQHRRRHVDDD